MATALPGAYCVFTVAADAPLTAPMPPMPEATGGLFLEFDAPLVAEASLVAAFQLVIDGMITNATQSARISALSQELAAENIVTLFQLDLSRFGGGVARFTTDVTENGQPLRWGGDPYYPTAVEATGFERKAGGTAARPSLRLGNVNKLITSLILEGKDLVGCEVRRYRTFRRFLDDGIEPSASDHFPAEIYRVERLKGRNKLTAEFELASILDQEGTKLPKRQIVRDYCSFIYRRWDAEAGDWKIDAFDPCPFAGTAMFDRKGAAVDDPARDVCGKRIRDCKLRFGEHGRLYTRAFPGVGRVH
jgi:lambda family phage minor tail protein L